MCGIAGILRFDGQAVDPSQIQSMLDAIAHRGPDGEGKIVEKTYGLGHRRLAIIDVGGGAQPMVTPDGTALITFNGEIYNFRELRAELEQAGVEFRTQSDTEVILQAWRAWGVDCLLRFRGMFAFCLVDVERGKYLLARDHFGIKPLLYSVRKEFLAFGSEFAALHRVAELKLTGSLQSMEYFLRFQYIPAPDTIYNEIRKLPQGHYLTGDLGKAPSAPVAYWKTDFVPEVGRTSEEWLERLDATLNGSVRAHLIADVPVGAFLSGGVDSTAVVSAMSKIADGFRAFSIGFEDERYSELSYAQEAADKLGVPLRTEVVRDDGWDDFPKLVAHYGEPFGDTSMIPTWRLAALARSEVTVAVSGDGGDEGFGGYGTYGIYQDVPKVKEYWRRLRRRFSKTELQAFFWAIGRRWFGRNQPLLAPWVDTALYTSRDRRAKLWRPEYQHLMDVRNTAFLEADREASRCDLVAYAQSMDFRTSLPGIMLNKVDIAAMYHGLEVRTPLLDVEVMKVAMALPAEMRYRTGEGGFVGKAILKDWLSKRLSSEFVHRPKQGFGAPRRVWFEAGRPGREFYESTISRMSAKLADWFRPEAIREMSEQHGEKRDRSSGMWLMLVLGLWLEQNPGLTFR
ncbi:MAG: asparagine synthase (glutamine-hydrolyzing) [Planctomycetes bacterium]|nr:asparagine synthase (glutamine-hydrolyzing) [Planctomycetota bacterium]